MSRPVRGSDVVISNDHIGAGVYYSVDELIAFIISGGFSLPDIGLAPIQLPLPGAVSRQLNAYLGDAINPKDFGAVGDGTADDTAAVQSALNTGRKVFLQPGSVFACSTLTAVSGSGLFGGGTLKLRTGSPVNLIAGDVSNFTVESITIDGNIANISGSAAPDTVAAIKLQAATATRMTGVRIRGVRLLRYPGDGLVLNGCDGATVSGCVVENTQGHGIVIAGSAAQAASRGCVVSGNAVRNTGAAGIILMGDGFENVCADNSVRDWNSTDFNVLGTSNGDGITAYDPDNDHLTVSGNSVINDGKCAGGHGIHFGGDHCSVTGNTIKNPRASGIFARSNGGTMNGGTIAGNSVVGGGADPAASAGIYVRLADNMAVTGNSIHAHARNGILLQQAAGLTVSANTIIAPGEIGIFCNDPDTIGNVQRTVIGGNVIRAPIGDGIRLELAQDVAVSDNIVVNANLAGGKFHIFIADSQLRNTVRSNILRDGGNGRKIRFPADASSVNRASDNFQSSSGNFQDAGAVASAATIRLEEDFETWIVSATNAIATINGFYDGRQVTLVFTGAASVNETGNVFLNAAAFTGASNKTLTLVYRAGTSKWCEVGRT